jgi:hypothetical protein
MALVPVEIFQQPTSLIGQIVGGQNTIAQALQGMFQVGRDLANNQVRDGRDFAAESARLDAIGQRRAENTQQQQNLDRSFARNVFEGDRSFEAASAERAIDNARADESAAFQRTDANRRFDIFKEDQAYQTAERDRVAAERAKAEGFNAKVAATNVDPFASEEEQAAIAKAKADAAKAAGDPNAFIEATGEMARNTRADIFGKPATRADLRAEESLKLRQQEIERNRTRDAATDAEKKAKETEVAREKKAKELIADTEAFRPQMDFVELEKGADGKQAYKDPVAASKAENFDKDRFASERAIATRVSKADYVALGKDIPPAAKKRRERFWELVNDGDAPAAPAPTPGAPGKVESPDELTKRLLGK